MKNYDGYQQMLINKKKQHQKELKRVYDSEHDTGKNEQYSNILISKNIINEIVHYHHITTNEMIAIPKDIHAMYSGIDLKSHHFLCKQIIDQIYPNLT